MEEESDAEHMLEEVGVKSKRLTELVKKTMDWFDNRKTVFRAQKLDSHVSAHKGEKKLELCCYPVSTLRKEDYASLTQLLSEDLYDVTHDMSRKRVSVFFHYAKPSADRGGVKAWKNKNEVQKDFEEWSWSDSNAVVRKEFRDAFRDVTTCLLNMSDRLPACVQQSPAPIEEVGSRLEIYQRIIGLESVRLSFLQAFKARFPRVVVDYRSSSCGDATELRVHLRIVSRPSSPSTHGQDAPLPIRKRSRDDGKEKEEDSESASKKRRPETLVDRIVSWFAK